MHSETELPPPASPVAPAPAVPVALPAPAGGNFWMLLLAGVIIAVVVALAYGNVFKVGFYFDDRQGITENDSITHLWPSWDKEGLHWDAVSPPNVHVAGALGRPLVNLTLAVNYSLAQSFSKDHDGLNVWNYHLFNIIFHILAAWILLATLRRAFLLPSLAPRFGDAALPLAFFIALIWAVHPLLTEVVTCVIQRNESLVAIFYLLTVYCFLRSVDAARQPWWRGWQASSRVLGWQATAVVACFLGVASKELMISAPIMVLLFDRAFVAGSFREALAKRCKFYLAMATSWLLLEQLMILAGKRGGTVGFGLDMTWWSYAFEQCYAVTHYFQLAFWPHPLVMDYGTDVVQHFHDVWKPALILALLVGATLWALWQRPKLGFASAWVFIILAPSSSIVPLTTQTMAEHRMYMPLITFVTLVVLGAYAFLRQYSYLPLGMLALLLAAAVHNRNLDYRDELTLWQVTAKQVPKNERALYNLAWSYIALDRYAEAVPPLLATIKIDPEYGEAHCNLGLCYIQSGDLDAAKAEFYRALEINYEDGQSHYNLGCVYLQLDDLPAASFEFQESAIYYPDYADAKQQLGAVLLSLNQPARAVPVLASALQLSPNNTLTLTDYGDALFRVGRAADAATAFESAISLGDHSAEIHKKLASALAAKGETSRALVEDQTALRLDPTDAEAHYLYGSHLAKLEQDVPAEAELAQAVNLRPDYPEADNSLGSVLVHLKRMDAAEAAYLSALHSNPAFVEAHQNLGTLYFHLNRLPEAETELRSALDLSPNSAEAHNNLGSVLVGENRYNEAQIHFQEALRLDPDYADASHNLKALQAALANPGN